MDYYKRKIIAMNLSESLANTNSLTIRDICFEVLKKTGMSERFTEKYIERLVEKGFYKFKGDIVVTT